MAKVTRLLCLFLLIINGHAISKEFVIGVEDIPYYPLFDFNQTTPTYTTELFNEFGKQYGHTFRYVPLPIKRFEKWLEENEIDFKYPDNPRWFADKNAHKNLIFSDSTLELVAGTLTKSDSDLTEDNFKVLGTILGFYPSIWIEKIIDKQINLFEHPSTMVLVRQVLEGQLDGIDLEMSVVNHYLAKLGREGELIINKDFKYEVYDYHLSTIKHKDVILQFNAFIAKNKTYILQLKTKFNIIDHKPYLG